MGVAREKWKRAKAEAERVLPKGFFTGADLGPLLDQVEAAEKKFDDLPGTASEQAETRAKTELKNAVAAARRATRAYTQLIRLALQGNRDNAPMTEALDKAQTVLSMQIEIPLRDICRRHQWN